MSSRSNESSSEWIFSSPFFWNSQKVCNFFTQGQNIIKAINSDDPKALCSCPETCNFIDHFATKYKLWGENHNWEDVLGDDYKLLVSVYGKGEPKLPKNVDTESVLRLFGVIRNRIVHMEDMGDEQKERCSWCKKTDSGHWVLNQRTYADFWIQKFPKLVLFIWLNLINFREHEPYKEFYKPEGLTNLSSASFEEVWCIQRKLSDFLSEQLNQGMVITSYKRNEDKGLALEFHEWGKHLFPAIGVNGATMEIEITENSLTCQWYEKSNGISKLVDTRKTQLGLKNEEQGQSFFTGSIIICGRVSDINENIIVQNICSNNCTVVFVCGTYEIALRKQEIEMLVGNLVRKTDVQLAQKDVVWDDLSTNQKQRVEEKGVVKFYDQILGVSDILPDDVNHRRQFLSHLTADKLNALLRHFKMELFTKASIPLLSDMYIERKLGKRMQINADSLQVIRKSNICVVTNIDEQDFKRLFECGFKKFNENGNISGRPEIYLIKDDKQIFSNLFSKFPTYSQPIHCFRYLYDDKLEWLESQGCTSMLESLFPEFEKDKIKHNEIEFEEKVTYENFKTIVIADIAGSGKSQVLSKIARNLIHKSTSKHFIFFFTANEFAQQLVGTNPTKETVINAILSLTCSTDFERNVLKYWLHSKNASNKIIEIMLDGLDEVQDQTLNSAIAALKISHTEIISLRVWVTLRDHMAKVVFKKINDDTVIVCRLSPLNEIEQIEFFTTYWQRHATINDNVCSRNIENFAEKCIQASFLRYDNDWACTPLMCWILAEMYKNREFSESLQPSRSFDPYKEIINIKFQIYFKRYDLNIARDNPIYNSLFTQLYRFHAYFAIKLIFGESIAKKFENQLLISQEDKQNLEPVVLQQGIIQSIYPLNFIHRTFAEHFVVWFLVHVLNGKYCAIDPDEPKFYNFLLNDVLAAKYKVEHCFTFVEFKNPVLVKSLRNTRYGITRNDFMSCWDLIYKLKVYTYFDFYGMFDLVIDKPGADVYLIQGLISNRNAVLFIGLVYTSAKFCAIACISTMFAHQYDCFDMSYIDKILEKASPGFKYCTGEKKYSAFHIAVLSLIFQPFYEGKGNSFMESSFQLSKYLRFLRYLGNKDMTMIEERDSRGRTPLLTLMAYLDQNLRDFKAVIEFLVKDMKADVNATDCDGNTVLHAVRSSLNIEELTIRRIRIDNSIESTLEIFTKLWTFFFENGLDNMKINACNKHGHTPLFAAVVAYGESVASKLDFFETQGACLTKKDLNTLKNLADENVLSEHFVNLVIEYGTRNKI